MRALAAMVPGACLSLLHPCHGMAWCCLCLLVLAGAHTEHMTANLKREETTAWESSSTHRWERRMCAHLHLHAFCRSPWCELCMVLQGTAGVPFLCPGHKLLPSMPLLLPTQPISIFLVAAISVLFCFVLLYLPRELSISVDSTNCGLNSPQNNDIYAEHV